MARNILVTALAVFLSGVALAATTSAVLPTLRFADFVHAWPAADRFSDGMLERIIAYPAALHGRATARRDIAADRLALKMWGRRAPWQFLYADMLTARGINAHTVAGCFVSQPQLSSWDAYNHVMLAEIDHRYGATFLKDVADRAKAESEERSARGERPW